MKPFSKKERNLFVTDYIRTFARIFVVASIFYLTGFYYFRDYFFAVYVIFILIGAAFSIYFIYYEAINFKPLLITKLKGNEILSFAFCILLINTLFIYTHVFFFGELYKNLILTILFVSLMLITAIYCGIYYYHVDKKLKSYYENLIKFSFADNTEKPEKIKNSYFDKKYYINKEAELLLIYVISYCAGVMAASLMSTLFAHIYAQGNEEFLITVFVSPLIIFLIFIPFPIIIYKKSINIKKTYTFLNIFHVFYQYMIFLMTPFIYGSLKTPNFAYMLIFIIMVFLIEIYIFKLTTNTEDSLNPLPKKIRN